MTKRDTDNHTWRDRYNDIERREREAEHCNNMCLLWAVVIIVALACGLLGFMALYGAEMSR